MPVYDKPMIYYPLSVLMLAGIREILIITTPHDQAAFQALLGDGSDLGMALRLCRAARTRRPRAGLSYRRRFRRRRPVALDPGRQYLLWPRPDRAAATRASARDERRDGLRLLCRAIPTAYGVVSFDADGRAETIEEKPAAPKSNYAVTGLYFYDGQAVERAHAIKPSPRGELEITDLNRLYLEAGELNVEIMGRGYAWLDTGTHGSLLDAANYVRITEERQGLKICCPEEICLAQGFIDDAQLLQDRRAAAQDRAMATICCKLLERRRTSMKLIETGHPRRADHRAAGVRRRARLLHGKLERQRRFAAAGLDLRLRAGQSQPLGARACCAACIIRSPIRRASWCG